MENQALSIIKKAILMEARGKALYQEVAQKTASPEVQHIFELMAAEEQTHIDYLAEQYKSFSHDKTFIKQDFKNSDTDDTIAKLILNPAIKDQISGAGFESAAITAAIDMETKAIEIYSKWAAESADENEKALFSWLAEWEKSHYEMLIKLDKELTEKIWFDNQFWPF
jgi:rubrerythrin